MEQVNAIEPGLLWVSIPISAELIESTDDADVVKKRLGDIAYEAARGALEDRK